MDNNQHFIYLSNNPVKFNPVSQVTHVFFDETNKQVFTVRSGGVTGVQVQGPKPELCHNFRMPDKGPVISIKLSPLQNMLALQRSKSSVEFMNLVDKELDEVEYSQTSRYKNAIIHGFVWSQPDEVVITTDQGIELFQVLPERRTLKALRNVNQSVTWFISCPMSKLVLLAGGPASANMQPISFYQPGELHKLPKFQIDIPVSSNKGTLLERDVTLANLYNHTCILVLRHPPRPPGAPPPGAQVLVYTIHRTLHTTRKTHVLSLEAVGRFALSIVDNLILVHHQASSTTLLFDTGGDCEPPEPVTLVPVLAPRSIRASLVSIPGQEQFHCPMYSPNWVVFQPNIIIDAKLGFLWYVEIDLPVLVAANPPPVQLVDLLLRRRPDSTLTLLLQVLSELMDPCRAKKTDLETIARVLDTVNQPYRKQLNALAQPHIGTPAHGSHTPHTLHTQQTNTPDKIVVDQSLMYSQVLSLYPEKTQQPGYDGEFALKVMLEYIRSLTDVQIPVQDVNELLITCLLRQEHGFARLYHLLQYRVLSDSKPLACSLLSLEKVYPPALQLSLDMLKRLKNSDDEIIEILLHKQLILPTLRFARSAGLTDSISARKFLEAAQAQNDPTLFYSVYRFFEQRNQLLKGSPEFAKGELCDMYVQHFNKLFINT